MPRGNQLLLLFILLIIMGSLGTYLLFFKEANAFSPSRYAMPGNTVAAVHFFKPEDMTAYNSRIPAIEEAISAAGANSRWNSWQNEFQNLMEDKRFKALLAKSGGVIGLNWISAGQIETYALLPFEDQADEAEIKKYFQAKDRKLQFQTHGYHGTSIVTINSVERKNRLSYTIKEGILILAQSGSTVEECLQTLERRRGVPPLLDYIGSLPVCAVVDFRLATQSLPTKFAYLLPHVGTKAVIQLKSSGDRLTLEGLLFNGEGHVSDMRSYSTTRYNLALDSFLPANARRAEQFGLYWSGEGQLRNAYYAQRIDEEKLAEISGRVGMRKDSLKLLIGNAMTMLNISRDEGTEVVVLDCRSATNAQFIERRINYYRSRSDSLSYEINSRRNKLWSVLTGGDTASAVSMTYANGRTLVLARTESDLNAYKAALPEGRFKSSYEIDARVLGGGYYSTVDLGQTLSQMKAERWMKGITGVQYQLYEREDSAFVNFTVHQTDGSGNLAELKWSTNLTQAPIAGPFVIQHDNESDWFIALQNRDNVLHCYDKAGVWKWKIELDGPIVGKVTAVPLYEHQPASMVFATANYLYMINHDGKPAGNYPIKLASPTKAGIALEYDPSGRQYLIFVPVAGRRVLAYYAAGKSVITFSYVLAAGEISNRLTPFKIGNEIFLSGITDNGYYHCWDMNGRESISKVKMALSPAAPALVAPGNTIADSRGYVLDSAGRLFTIAHKTSSFSNINISHKGKATFFDLFDGNGDGKQDIIIGDRTKVSGYDAAGKEQWKIVSDNGISFPLQKITWDKHDFLGYTSAGVNKVYLYNLDLTMFKGFPKPGNSPFAHAKSAGRGLLIVSTADKRLVAYNLLFN